MKTNFAILFIFHCISCNQPQSTESTSSQIESDSGSAEQLVAERQHKFTTPESVIPHGYRIPRRSDVNVNSGWYYFFNDEGNKGFPFQAEGDFNHDGKDDVAYLLIHQDNKDGLLVCACSIKDEYFLIKLDAFDAYKLQENMIASENSVELCNDTGSNSLSTKGTYFKDDVIMIGPYASDFLGFYVWNAERSAFEGGWYPCEVEEE